MISSVLIVLFYLFVPALILRLCHLFKSLDRLGPILICYIVGMVFGVFFIDSESIGIPDMVSTVMIPVALPMLLFEVDLKNWKKVAGKAFLSMGLAVVGLLIMITSAFLVFRSRVSDAHLVGGMLTGIYTGGTPNLAAIKTALNAPEDTFLAVNTMDMFVCTFYILFLLSYAKPLFGKMLRPYPAPSPTSEGEEAQDSTCRVSEKMPFRKWLSQVKVKEVLKALSVSLVCVAVGGGLGLIVKNPAYQMAVIILAITTCGIIAANMKPVKKIQGGFDTGMYLILVFSVAVASMADFRSFTAQLLPLMGFVAMVVFGTLLLHLILCKIFKVDVDTMIVTSAALVCSPPFVPGICGALKNRQVMMSGITVGVFGYAIGNYLGIALTWFLQWLA